MSATANYGITSEANSFSFGRILLSASRPLRVMR